MTLWKSGVLLPRDESLDAGHQETKIGQTAVLGMQTAQVLEHLLNNCRVYHFQDTSSTASVPQNLNH